MLTFRQFISESITHTDDQIHAAAKELGPARFEPGEFPDAKRGGEFHAFITRDGNFYHVADHGSSSKKMNQKLGIPHYKEDNEHGNIAGFLRATGAVRVSNYGKSLGVSSHHPLSDAQQRVIKHAMLNQGYDSLIHDYKEDTYEASKDFHGPRFNKALHNALTVK